MVVILFNIIIKNRRADTQPPYLFGSQATCVPTLCSPCMGTKQLDQIGRPGSGVRKEKHITGATMDPLYTCYVGMFSCA